MNRPAASSPGSTSRRLENSPVRTSRPPQTANIRRVLARRLIGESPVAEGTFLIIGSVVGAMLWDKVPKAILIPWMGAIFGAAFVRFLVRRHYSAIPGGPPGVPFLLRAIIIAGGFAWGTGTLIFGRHVPTTELSLFMVVICGL